MKKTIATIIFSVILLLSFAQTAEQKKDYDEMMRNRDSAWNVKLQQRDSALNGNVKKDEAKFKAECIKKFGKVKGNKIYKGEITIGDTKEMVLFSWGNCDDIWETLTSGTQYETWYWKKQKTAVSFKKDIVVMLTAH